MSATLEAPRLPVVNDSAGEEIKRRRVALGMSVSKLAEMAGIDRGRLSALESGDSKVRPATIGAVKAALDRLETEMGIDAPPPAPSGGHVVRFEVKGVYGADALVVEGPIEDIAELEEAVDRIMRRIQGRGEISAHIEERD